MDLAEKFGRSLKETLQTVDHDELYLWVARNELRRPKGKG